MIYDVMGRIITKAVSGALIQTETTSNTYDEPRSNFFNNGQLTSATRAVPAYGPTIPAVNVARQFDYDVAGRLSQETHLNVNGANRTIIGPKTKETLPIDLQFPELSGTIHKIGICFTPSVLKC